MGSRVSHVILLWREVVGPVFRGVWVIIRTIHLAILGLGWSVRIVFLRLISRAISWLIVKGWEVNVFKYFVRILGVLPHRIIGIYHGSVMRTWWRSVELLYFRKEFFNRRFASVLLGGGMIHQLWCRIIWRCLRRIVLFFWGKIQESTKDFSF